MTLLYRGRHRERFTTVAALIRDADRTVLELCFGDVAIAAICRRRGKKWIGLDVSEAFVAHAVKQGFDARVVDLARTDAPLPACDVCVMMGSLYHFEPQLLEFFQRIKKVSSRFILSEPVRNWTHSGGVLRFLARKCTRVNVKEETYRFDAVSLIEALDSLRKRVGFDYRVVSVARDMVVEVAWSK